MNQQDLFQQNSIYKILQIDLLKLAGTFQFKILQLQYKFHVFLSVTDNNKCEFFKVTSQNKKKGKK